MLFLSWEHGWVANRLVVLLEKKTYIHDLGQLTILDTIDTVSNPRGSILCTFYYLKHFYYILQIDKIINVFLLLLLVLTFHSHLR